eukprot:scaffold241660_cov19-Tisochrysis_lutea.AAC.2
MAKRSDQAGFMMLWIMYFMHACSSQRGPVSKGGQLEANQLSIMHRAHIALEHARVLIVFQAALLEFTDNALEASFLKKGGHSVSMNWSVQREKKGGTRASLGDLGSNKAFCEKQNVYHDLPPRHYPRRPWLFQPQGAYLEN